MTAEIGGVREGGGRKQGDANDGNSHGEASV
jgi:hypothetical protein